MIPKMSSEQLNNLMLNAEKEIEKINTNVDVMKQQIDKKLLITNYEELFIERRLEELKHGILQPKLGFKSLITNSKGFINKGNYSIYGATVFPKVLNKPINVFNVQLDNNKIFFRQDVKATIKYKVGNEEIIDQDHTLTDILKHDDIEDKKLFFKEFETESQEFYFDLEIESDIANPLGPVNFNTIEIDSFLPGSYDILDVVIPVLDINGNTTYQSIKNKMLFNRDIKDSMLEDVGQCKILLSEKINLNKLIFKIKLKYLFQKGNKNIFPFGIKHLYFYDNNYNVNKTKEQNSVSYGSYIITSYTLQDSNKTIDKIFDSVTIKSVLGDIDTTMSEENIEMYLDYIEDTLDTPVYPGENIIRITDTIYFKIPLTKLEAWYGISFSINTKDKTY